MIKKIILIVLMISMLSISALAEVGVSLINQDPNPALAGYALELRIGIENRGNNQIENFNIELLEEYPFTLLPGEEGIQNIGTINKYQQGDYLKFIKYNVRVDKDAIAGTYEFKVKYSQGGTDVVKSINIDVKSKESAEVIHIDKTMLVPGKETSLKFTINNVGSAPLRDLTFSFENADDVILPVGSDNTRYIKYIDIGESEVIEYKVIADTSAVAGLYKLDLYLIYDDPLSDTDKQITTKAGLYVGGGTDFDVSFSDNNAGETSFSVANIGSNPANSVSVNIPKQDGWRVSGSNSVIIGNLNKGDYTVASFKLSSMSSRTFGEAQDAEAPRQRSSESTSSLKVEIAYTDTMGNRKIVRKEVELSPQSLNSGITHAAGTSPNIRFQQESFFSKYKWPIIILVVLVVGYFGHKRYMPKKKR